MICKTTLLTLKIKLYTDNLLNQLSVYLQLLQENGQKQDIVITDNIFSSIQTFVLSLNDMVAAGYRY